MTKDNLVYIRHMLEAIDHVMEFTKTHSIVSFVEDIGAISSCAYQIQTIGEAASKISPQLTSEYPEIAWQDAIDTRHKLVHHYMKIDPEILWDITQKDLPILKTQLSSILQKLES